MATLIDGLGGEEVNASGSNLNTQSAFFLGSVTATSLISGNQVFSTGSVLGARVSNVDGAIFSNSIGSPGLFSAFIQAGSVTTGAGSDGFVKLKQAFTGSFFITFTPRGFVAGGGSVVPFTSGTTSINSGCTVIGAASTTYNWIAIGV